MAASRRRRDSPDSSSRSGVADQSATTKLRSPARWPSGRNVGSSSSSEVSSSRRLPRDTVREPIDPRGIAAHQGFEGAAVAGCRAREQGSVVGAHAEESTPRGIRVTRRGVQTFRGGDHMADDFEYVSKTRLVYKN